MRVGTAYHDLGRRVPDPSSRRPEDSYLMNHSVDPAVSRLPCRGRAFLAGLLLVALLVSPAFAPAPFCSPVRDRRPAGASAMLTPFGRDLDSKLAAPGVETAHAAAAAPDDSALAVVNQADPEPGVGLISAVYNSIQDRFFKPLDS